MRARELRAFDVRAVFEKLLTKNDKGANAHQLLGPESAPSCDLSVFSWSSGNSNGLRVSGVAV